MEIPNTTVFLNESGKVFKIEFYIRVNNRLIGTNVYSKKRNLFTESDFDESQRNKVKETPIDFPNLPNEAKEYFNLPKEALEELEKEGVITIKKTG